ncbi:hypothetical protein P5624_01790 [Bacillus subtilis]|nr:hypothetical protein P5624_01790 [Bacillus subtilis]WGD78921.1 hypothetical protein P5643_01475 [Bacillus subtilis]
MDLAQEHQSNSNKLIIGNDAARKQQIEYWSKFFFNNRDYMERSLNAVSRVNTEQAVSLKFTGKDLESGIVNSHTWSKEWDLILNGELEDLPASWIKREKKFNTFIEQFIKLAFTKLKDLQIYKQQLFLQDSFF